MVESANVSKFLSALWFLICFWFFIYFPCRVVAQNTSRTKHLRSWCGVGSWARFFLKRPQVLFLKIATVLAISNKSKTSRRLLWGWNLPATTHWLKQQKWWAHQTQLNIIGEMTTCTCICSCCQYQNWVKQQKMVSLYLLMFWQSVTVNWSKVRNDKERAEELLSCYQKKFQTTHSCCREPPASLHPPLHPDEERKL